MIIRFIGSSEIFNIEDDNIKISSEEIEIKSLEVINFLNENESFKTSGFESILEVISKDEETDEEIKEYRVDNSYENYKIVYDSTESSITFTNDDTVYEVYAVFNSDRKIEVYVSFPENYHIDDEISIFIKKGQGKEFKVPDCSGLIDERGLHNYKIDSNGNIVEVTSEEKEAFLKYLEEIENQKDVDELGAVKDEVTSLQLALVEQYEENINLTDEVTSLELALVEQYEENITLQEKVDSILNSVKGGE